MAHSRVSTGAMADTGAAKQQEKTTQLNAGGPEGRQNSKAWALRVKPKRSSRFS